MRSETGPAASAVARWRFVPRRAVDPSPAGEAEFRLGLRTALRSAHALGARLALALRSGPAPALFLEALDAPSARWTGRTLPETYGPTQWVEVGPRADPDPSVRSAETWGPAHRRFGWPEPLVHPEPAAPSVDLAALVLRSAGPGLLLRWSWNPVPPPRARWWHAPPEILPPSIPAPRAYSRAPRAPAPEPSPASAERPLVGRLDLTVATPPVGRSRTRPAGLRALETVLRTPRGNGVDFGRRPRPVPGRLRSRPDGMLLTVDEWASWWPGRRCPAGGPPPVLAGGARWPLGRTAVGEVVGPWAEPHQGRHLAVLGETGMGKSSLLVALAGRVFDRDGGVVFDPVGDTAAAIRDTLPPAARGRLRWIAPGPDAVTLNALDGAGPGTGAEPEAGDRRLRDLVFAFRRVRHAQYEAAEYWGPRLDEVLTRALRAAAALPRGTLADAHLLLETGGRLGRPVPAEAIGAVADLARRIQDRPDDAEGARRLLHEVVGSPILSRMLCDPEPTVRVGPLVAPGAIVLVSGEAGQVGEATARRLLAVYLGLVWSELLARPLAPKTVVMLDEAQWFAHDSLAEMLKLGRKRNVHVVLATQSIASFRHPNVEESVRTNVADFVVFRGSPREARELEETIPALRAEAVLSLPRGRAALLLGKGEQLHWIRTARPPFGGPPPPPAAPPSAPGRALPGSGPASPGGAGSPTSLPATSVSPDLAAHGRVVGALLERFRLAEPARPLVVSLPELRREADPTGEAIRRLGSRLGRAGVCVRGTGPGGVPVWHLDPRAADVLRESMGPDPPTGSAASQPS